MTAKRFTKYIPDSYGYTYITTIIDNEKNKQTGNIDEIVDMLNELNDENTRLLKANMELTEENTSILNTIRTAYQSERTTLGRNTLKQLIEALE